MGNNLTKIVLDTERLEKEVSYKIGHSLAINYQARKLDSWVTVFLVPNELVAQQEEQGNHLEVTLRDGMTPKIECGELLIKTNRPKVKEIVLPYWLGKKVIRVPVPFRREIYYCTELKYLISVHKGDKVLYQRQ